MVKAIVHAWEQFKEGASLTLEERLEVEQTQRTNRENDEAILGGYSVSPRIYRTPKIPGILERVRRGLGALLSCCR